MVNSSRTGQRAAWSVVALASGGSAIAAAAAGVGGVVVGHPVAGLVIAGCVLIVPWLLIGILVVTMATVVMRGANPGETTKMIEALRTVIETLLQR